MDPETLQNSERRVLAIAREQHGAITRVQLVELGFDLDAIRHRVARGRLHLAWPGVYAVGRPGLSSHGRWLAAVLSCGPSAVLSHLSAGELWEIRPGRASAIHVSVPAAVNPRDRTGVVIHRCVHLGAADLDRQKGIPVTAVARTLVDLAASEPRGRLEAVINEADKRNLIDPEQLRFSLRKHRGRRGVKALRETLDRRTFRLTDSELERMFLRMVAEIGLPRPETGRRLNGFKVDFYWPHLGLVVETDGLRYHRTAAQQSRDRLRDQTHVAAGLTCLRFTHAQIKYEPGRVRGILTATLRRLLANARADVSRP